MNIKVIGNDGNTFTMYGMDFVPSGSIIHNDNVYSVDFEIWNDDISELILKVRYAGKNTDTTDPDLVKIDELIIGDRKLEAIRTYKETYHVGLKEAKDWVDARALILRH